MIADVIKKVVFGPSTSSSDADASSNVLSTNTDSGNSTMNNNGNVIPFSGNISAGTPVPPSVVDTATPTSASTSSEILALQKLNEELKQRHLEELETTRQTAFQGAFGMLMSQMKHFDAQDVEKQKRLLSLTITAEKREEWEPFLGDEWEIIKTLQGKIQMDEVIKSQITSNMNNNEELFAQAFLELKQRMDVAIQDREEVIAQLKAQQQQHDTENAVQQKEDERVALAQAEQLQRLELEVSSLYPES